MTTQRQIAANRQNSRRSTGPRSIAGKKRAGHNSHRHGFATPSSYNSKDERLIKELMRSIAGGRTGSLFLEQARDLAEAQFDLLQIRKAKVSLVNWELAFGASEDLPDARSAAKAVDVVQDESSQTAEALRTVLPELVKLDRYEQRAAARRDKSLRLVSCTISLRQS